MLWLEAIKTRLANAGLAEENMQRTKPPFRADHVGSILRTAPVKDARAKREQGAISADQLTVCLSSCESGSWKVHVATFFTEVRPELVLRFAELHGVSMSELASAYHAMKVVTGEANPVLEADLEQLAPTAR